MNTESIAANANHQYRVFLSYSRDDLELFNDVRSTLEKECNFSVLSDQNIGAGTPFTDAIKGLITHAHIFIPLITENAQKRPWVHQETGYAMARNIPVLPIVVGDTIPSEMIAQLQAISVDSGSEVAQHLRGVTVESLIFPRPPSPAEMVSVADWPEQRAELLVDHANRVRELGAEGMFRQRGALSSFCIPDVDISDAAWETREGRNVRSPYYRHLLRGERQVLEWHASRAGCRLILDTGLKFKNRGLMQTIIRLETLLEFLEAANDFPVEVVFSPLAREGSLTLVGNWFVAESIAPRPGGYHQTVFNWHAPTVSRWVTRFDDQFYGICRSRNLEHGKTRAIAIEHLTELICEHRKEMENNKNHITLDANCHPD